MIGSYRLEGLIGAGGMGAVYLATRADREYEQKVAIKLLHAGAASSELVRRFRAERQILAVLDHPEISRLLDGGTDVDGRPYLVMEYVDGTPLDRYCDEHQLGVRQRIELFLKVCDPVAFAHRRLVVHRDLKPGNILVTEKGEPKLLDFGIAKLLDPAAIPGGDEATRTGLRPMSPAYASPEQIRGRPITTGSDVYSLGVMLYKLLARTLPHRFDDLSPLAMDRELNRDPTAPSMAVSEAIEQASTLRRRLKGDLDAIVLKALREEPEQRYASVGELADDLKRHLDGLPVSARRGTMAYRTGRYLGRHKVAVGMTAIVMALAAVSSIAVGLQAKRVVTERDKAQQISYFLQQLFRAPAVMEAGGGELTLREVVDAGADRVRTELGDQPEIQSTLLGVLGITYYQLGLYDKAELILAEHLEASRRASIEVDPRIAPALNHLAAIYLDGEDPDKTQALVERALELGRRGVPDDPFALPDSLSLMGDLMHLRGQDVEALDYYREALEIAAETHGEDNPYYAYRLVYMATGLQRIGSDEAEDLFLRALEIQRASPVPDDTGIMITLLTLGDYYRNRKQLDRAVPIMEEALVIGENRLGKDHPQVGEVLQRLALVHTERGDLAVAETHAAKFRAIVERDRSPTSPAMSKVNSVSADLLIARGELGAARDLWAQILAATVANRGPEHRKTALAGQKIALLDHFGGESPAGIERMTAALAAFVAAAPDEHPRLAQALAMAATIHLGTKTAAEAEAPLRRAMAIWRSAGYERTAVFAAAQIDLAATLVADDRAGEAQPPLNEALGILEKLMADDPCPRYLEIMAEAKIVEGDLRKINGDTSAAATSWTEALELLNATSDADVGADHHLLAGETLLRLGRENEVETHARWLADRGWRWPEWVTRGSLTVKVTRRCTDRQRPLGANPSVR